MGTGIPEERDRQMKIIISRKGFDWSNGGTPSPVMPDGTLLSMPIPSYDDVCLNELSYGNRSYADIMNELKKKSSFMHMSCHLDPDVRTNNRTKLPKNWVPAFGQIDAAETHLENQGVEVGDLFLFFGWFGETKEKNGQLKYAPSRKDLHVLWGYLQIGKISRGKDCLNYPWHPHCYNYGNNTIYEASEKLVIDGVNTGLPGAGCLKYSDEVVLTKPGETRSRWLLPDFFKEVSISCHTKDSFKPEGYFQTVKIGQEFVVSEDSRVTEWAKNIILNNYDEKARIDIKQEERGKDMEEANREYEDEKKIVAANEGPSWREVLEHINLSEQLNKRIVRENKRLIVLKGFGVCDVDVGIEQLYSFSRDEINNNSCGLNPVILQSMDKLKTGDCYYILYEDFIVSADTIMTLLKLNGYKVSIIDNNLFDEYYPLADGYDANKIKNHVDNYKNEQLTEIFDDYISVDSNIMVSYQTFKDLDETELIPLYSFDKEEAVPVKGVSPETNVISLGSTSTSYSLTLYEILKAYANSCYIKEEENALSQYRDNLIRVLSGCGYSVYKASSALPAAESKKYDEYEEILKRKNSAYTFRNIDFYTNPGFSLDTTSISQGEIIDAIVYNAKLANEERNVYNDTFVTAPTGSGKSVLFQIPAIYLAEKYELFTIVISPLIGLMNDQVENLKLLTDKAATINSEYTPEEKEEIKKKIQNKEISILYVSPETLLSNNPITTLIGDERQIGLLVVDESHIVSTWGKSFRPDYWFLGDYISKMRAKDGMRFPIATFSATVTYGGDDDMHGDIIDSLHMKTGRYEYIAPMRRDDIRFDIRVLEKINDYQKEKDVTAQKSLSTLLEEGKKTIAYFPYTRTVNEYSRIFAGEGVGRYHGGLHAIEKRTAAEDFKSGKTKLMLATKAFGMGIDIDDIEVVYHYAPTGNLSDYVQEIGRAARREDITGLAKVDFYKDNDYKFINQLFGMSSIKNYQIVETLRKLAKTYYDKKQRNFTVSPDDFGYIFGTDHPDEVDTAFKTTLLMIQKDFERQSLIFKPLVFKPRSLFTRAYVMVKDENKAQLQKNRFRKYFRLYATGDEMASKFVEKKNYLVKDKSEGSGYKVEQKDVFTSVRYQGDVYLVDLKSMWEENFNQISFNQFKFEFYTGKLKDFEIGKDLLPEYILTVRTKEQNFAEMVAKYREYMNELDNIFSTSEFGAKQFTVAELAKLFEKSDVLKLDHYESIVAATTFIRIINAYKSKKQLSFNVVFKYNSATEKYAIASMSALRSAIKELIKQAENQYKQTFLADTRSFLIGNKDNEANKDNRSLVAQLMEMFNLAAYDVLSGERPEYFIRVNSITAIERIINDENYQSEMVKMVRKRHEDAKKRMTTFFTKLKTDKERWDYIEKYFAGIQEEFGDDSTES